MKPTKPSHRTKTTTRILAVIFSHLRRGLGGTGIVTTSVLIFENSDFTYSILLITMAFDPPRSNTFPLTVTCFPAKGSSLSFWLLDGVVSAMGQYIVPLGARITNGDPALAHATAHSALIGFFRPLVNAQAESST